MSGGRENRRFLAFKSSYIPNSEDPSVFEVISGTFPRFLTDLPEHWQLIFSSGPSGDFYSLGHYKNRD